MTRKVCGLLMTSAVFAVVISSTAKAQDEESESELSAPIEGSWITRVYRPTSGVTFTALQSFTAGGVALATGSIDRTPLPPISPIYGSWKRTAPNTYDVTMYFFVFRPDGEALAMVKNNLTLHLDDRNHLMGSGVDFQCGLEGESCMRLPDLPIQITGKRIVPEGPSE